MSTNTSLESFNIFSEKAFSEIQSPSKKLKEAMKYSFFSGGKRIRAQFVYALGEAFNIDLQNCHKIAFAIECIHTYSLIHDDLPAMDNDVLRRGKPTCHIKFNEATAILAGDALQSLGFEIINTLDINDIYKLKKVNIVFAKCCGLEGMVGGQQLDIDGENQNLKLQDLEILHINKTAKMFRASIVLPYIVSKYNNDEFEAILTKVSDLIGLCFQIKDDILDVTRSTQELGKTSGKDINANKSTYVSLMGLDGANKYLFDKKNEIRKLLSELNKKNLSTQNLEKLIDLVINRNY
ncbi:polyprenyl synthetase family protein [Francisella philomiragia]|uniref:Polyprenyl synthetase family protein n=1 Tax=Francisella philomiragia TaxID=28110 RepID=A0AAW3DBB5_9GAMM|nr:farnesyl diphosphate synthase [Francisella philomiragia]AJI55629.1 polyprenyl synthetase family protein [Francisella philomiragia]AJI57502.1 polyprenyl synthetase family protein [Francisella philomiragia]AJI75719.1 polyprenyl synthetase family protein [Francisella philomiragia subsp. philomiragia ATCC 25015]EET20970.1 geranyltranstransferase [Francisella philomiragia subsp. philomiragia ATCC 25015]KFJ42637.1 polyprenyl synthetase family protein [Francisella philomiragia]